MNFITTELNQAQPELLSQAGPWLAGQKFYLAGGTTLAIYFGHRHSVDLDWFTAVPVPDPMQLAQHLRDAGLEFETGQTAPGTLYGRAGGVRFSLIENHYPLLQPLEGWPETGANLASLDDLACMKLSAIAQSIVSSQDFRFTPSTCPQNRRDVVKIARNDATGGA
jgi:hypothetical protein